MKRRTFVTATAGGLALTAGCMGALGGDDQGRGTVRFYVSDEPNRIDDFETLDVTISTVALKPASEDDEDDANGNESETDDGVTDGDADSENADGNESTEDTDDSTDSADDETAADETDDGEGGDAPEDGRGGWDEYDLDDPTVDLTKLKGPKATVLDELDVPAGEYVAVDMFVSDIHAVLTDGTETTLKIPSERLKIRTPFTVAADEELDFVYDIAPKKAGQSGKYILTPVISESGTEAEIEEVDASSDGGA
ncbi:hypothetical protein Halru_0241 [Halovivax ruber XH-70]|uniref:DUF4382 domain-containing protein n=1 Tax=Halovivax ruber (strain DSM 18193 / JCM 13892 / XH-70) TaxID=797302 RepID=L0IAC5_HALRX|nr:DUF4382 domain-containing protein [Halovivax ruber]AGB14887.1 hypothetical protein Halru_0241 [Halovivax ruber XH-70]